MIDSKALASLDVTAAVKQAYSRTFSAAAEESMHLTMNKGEFVGSYTQNIGADAVVPVEK